MWTLTHPSLPPTPSDRGTGDLCVLDLGYTDPPLAVIDYQAKWRSPDVIRVWKPVTVPITIPALTSGIVTLDVPFEVELTHLDAIEAAGQAFTPALDLDNPQPGEFTWITVQPEDFEYQESDLPIQSVMLYPSENLPANTAVTLTGGSKNASVSTNYLSALLLKTFAGLPLTGTLTWTLNLEQHPSGSLQLICQGDDIENLRSQFKQGSEFELFGIGFSVSNYQEKVKPIRLYEVSVSLNGKWAKSKYNRPSFLRKDAQGLADSVPITSTQQATQITIAELAEQVDVPFYPLQSGNARWDVDIPADTAKDASQVWSSGLQELCRPNGGYVDWNSVGGVYVCSIDRTQRQHWRYSIPELGISYQGNCEHADDHRGYAVEYVNVQLTGEFQETASTPSREPKPEWKRRTPKVVTLTSGDTDAAIPPEDITVLKNLSHNWDSSGRTKTLRTSTTVDGQPSQETEVIYGYCYTARQIFSDSRGELYGTSPGSFWQIVSYKQQTYLYDPQYGYPLGYNVDGYRFSRFKQESDDAMETLSYNSGDPEDAAFYNLYVFRSVPLYERSRTLYETFNKYYSDAEEEPAWVAYTHVNRDGSEETRYVKDPTWAPTVFAKESLTYVGSFASTPNPEYDPQEEYGDEYPPPPKLLITGEESIQKTALTLKPGRKSRRRITGTGVDSNQITETILSLDLYVERSLQDSAQNAGFGQKAIQDTFNDHEGRPSPATRKPSLLEQEEPESEEGDRVIASPTEYSYSITTLGYTLDDPIDGSISYSNATTIDDALTGAKTELAIRDVQESIQYSFVVPFNARLRPLHRMTLNVQGETYKVSVVSVTQTIKIGGNVEGEPLITVEPTQITAGVDREIPVTLHKTPIPQSQDQDSVGADPTPDNPEIRLSIGTLFKIPPKNRGNY